MGVEFREESPSSTQFLLVIMQQRESQAETRSAVELHATGIETIQFKVLVWVGQIEMLYDKNSTKDAARSPWYNTVTKSEQ